MRKQLQFLLAKPPSVFILSILLFISAITHAQTAGKVSGTVLDSAGAPLMGVSVTVKQTGKATMTDAAGKFAIDAQPKQSLVVSIVGYEEKEVSVGSQANITVSLSTTTNALNDVVVVGYGSVKRKDLTGSVGIVNVADAKKTATYDVARMLQGQAAGISVQGSGEPGGYVNIKVRGVGSIYNTNPLFVIDGIETDAPFDFPTSDIESIQILKDASAGSIYGSRGAGGVIIITTKKGNTGQTHISYNGYYGLQNITKKLPLTNRTQYQQITDAAEANAGIPLAAANDPTSPSYITNTNTNWQDAAFKTGIIQDHTLSLSGGTQSTSYNISLDYFGQTATVKGGPGEPKYNRYNVSANIQSKKGIISYGAKLAYTQSHKQNITYPHQHPNVGNEIVDLDRAIPTVPVYDSTRLGGFGGTDQLTQKAIVLNIIGMNNLMNSYSDRNRFLGDVWAELEPIKNLKYRVNLSYDRTDTRDFFFEPLYDLGWYYVNNTSYETDNRGSGYHSIVENTLSYKVLAGKSTVDLLAGTAYEQTGGGSITGLESGFNIPYYYTFPNGNASTASLNSYTTTATLSSLFGRVNYNYDSRYLLTVNYRRDGSSRFSPQNRYGNFSSVAGAWNVSNEKFIHLPKLISNLKLRGGYGTLGNQAFPSDYAYTAIVNPNASYLFATAPNSSSQTLAQGTTQTAVADPSLKWETKTTSYGGLDLGLLNNKLTVTAEYYSNTTKDIIAQPPIPISVGAINTPYVNAASFRNNGLEFTVTYHKSAGEFTYNISANLSTLKNKVLQLGGTNDPIYGAESKTEVGREVGEIYGYVTQGIFQNAADIAKHATQANAAPGDLKFKDIDGDGVITANDQTYLGSAIPKMYYGLSFNASYKNFDVSFSLQGNSGNKIVNGLQQALMAGQYTNHYIDELNYWTPTNTNTNVPRPVIGDPNGNNRGSDRWVQDGSYIKLQNIQIGYNLPAGLLKRTNAITNVRFYISGQNVFTITKYKGYDPDIISDGLFSRGFDYGSFPNPRTVMFGLQAGF